MTPDAPESQRKPPFLLGIAGGSGSGKSTVARAVLAALPPGAGVLLEQDHYYRPQSHLSLEEREKVNYDHPDSLEFDLLLSHVAELGQGRAIVRPTYEFARHDRDATGKAIEPAPVVIVEGILVLTDERLRARMDVKLFVDTDADIRLMRRIRRDSSSTGAAASPRFASSTTRPCARCIWPSSSRPSASPTSSSPREVRTWSPSISSLATFGHACRQAPRGVADTLPGALSFLF